MESCLNYNEWEISDRVKIVTYRERGGGEKERARERERNELGRGCASEAKV